MGGGGKGGERGRKGEGEGGGGMGFGASQKGKKKKRIGGRGREKRGGGRTRHDTTQHTTTHTHTHTQRTLPKRSKRIRSVHLRSGRVVAGPEEALHVGQGDGRGAAARQDLLEALLHLTWPRGGQNQRDRSHFGAGAPPNLGYFRGNKPFWIQFWLVGEFTTHVRTHFSGWIGRYDLGVDPGPNRDRMAHLKSTVKGNQELQARLVSAPLLKV